MLYSRDTESYNAYTQLTRYFFALLGQEGPLLLDSSSLYFRLGFVLDRVPIRAPWIPWIVQF